MVRRDDTIAGREIRSRWLRMKCVAVQWIGHVYDTLRRIHADRWTVDWIWHRSVESPVPVWDPQTGGRGLILASLVCGIRCCDLLGDVPENLLEECHVGSMP